MSKKFKSMICVYCGLAKSDSPDHVFARQFFLVQDRANLPKVPSCRHCNGLKAQLEHYALIVLPFGGRHPAAPESLAMVGPRLDKNQKLKAELDAGRARVWVQESPTGVAVPTTAIPLDASRLSPLFTYIARGLTWHHWQLLLPADAPIEVVFPRPQGDQWWGMELQKTRGRWMRENLGNQTIQYEGFQAADDPNTTYWRLYMFGGVAVAGKDPAEGSANVIVVATGMIAAALAARKRNTAPPTSI